MKTLLARCLALIVPLILVGSSQASFTLGGQSFHGVYSFNLSTGQNVGAGVFRWSTLDGVNIAPDYEFTFCVDLAHYIQNPSTYDPVGSDSALIQSNTTKAANLKALFDTNSTTVASIVADPNANTANAAALQLAIWEIIYETSGTLNVSNNQGSFYVKNQAAIVATAQSYLDNMSDTPTASYSIYGLNAVAPTASSQDQIRWVLNPSGAGTPVSTPAPPALLLALLGVVGMGGVSRLRSRFGR
jgi:hypothetical protein